MCLPVLFMASCIKHDLPPCENGDVTIRLFVERFEDEAAFTRADISATSEKVFSDRIHRLDYYLYKDGELIESGPVKEDVGRINGDAYAMYLLCVTVQSSPPTSDHNAPLRKNTKERVISSVKFNCAATDSPSSMLRSINSRS